mgnify:CR=1 FL=1
MNLALTSLPDLVRQKRGARVSFFIPSAMLLAALHGGGSFFVSLTLEKSPATFFWRQLSSFLQFATNRSQLRFTYECRIVSKTERENAPKRNRKGFRLSHQHPSGAHRPAYFSGPAVS